MVFPPLFTPIISELIIHFSHILTVKDMNDFITDKSEDISG